MKYFKATVTFYFEAEDGADHDDIFIHVDDALDPMHIAYRTEKVEECDHDYCTIAQ